jgi:hypothetical protein
MSINMRKTLGAGALLLVAAPLAACGSAETEPVNNPDPAAAALPGQESEVKTESVRTALKSAFAPCQDLKPDGQPTGSYRERATWYTAVADQRSCEADAADSQIGKGGTAADDAALREARTILQKKADGAEANVPYLVDCALSWELQEIDKCND